jgi:hypothetical protein
LRGISLFTRCTRLPVGVCLSFTVRVLFGKGSRLVAADA